MAITSSQPNIANPNQTGNAHARNPRKEAGALREDVNKSNSSAKTQVNSGKKKFKVKSDVWSIFTGFYSFLTYLGVVSNQVENYVAMATKHITNAESISDETKANNSDYKEYAESASSKPSIFKKLLAVPAKMLGIEKDYDGLTSFYARALDKVFSPLFGLLGFKLPFNLPTDGDPNAEKSDFNFISHRTEDDPKGHIRKWVEQVNPDPSVNAEREGLSGLWYNLNHPTTSRNALSFIFNIRNDIQVLRDKTPPNIGALGKFLNVVKIISSSVASVFAPAGSFLAWMFALAGKKALITASSLWALVGAIHIPGNHALELAINLCSAVGTSKKTGKPLKECLAELDMLNFGKLFHGVLGGIAAVPSTLGSFARMFQTYKDTRYVFVPSAREFAKVVHSFLNKIGLASNVSLDTFEETGAAFVKGSARILRDTMIPFAENVINLAPLRMLLKTVFPVVKDPQTGSERIPLDVYRQILTDIENTETDGYKEADDALVGTENEKYKYFLGTPTVDAFANNEKIEKAKENLLFGFIPKSETFMYLFKTFGVFEQWSISMAYAFDKWLDKDIQENAIAPLRWFDKVMGTINIGLSIPNAIIYGITARAPQLLAGFFDIMQRVGDARGWTSAKGGEEQPYDVMQDKVIPLTKKLMNSSFPLFRYIGKSLNEDLVFNVYGKDVFKDPAKANDLITNFYEKLSFKQEYSIEAPAAVQYLRNLIKWGMNHVDFLHAGGK